MSAMERRQGLGVLGILVALVGIALQSQLVVWLAIAMLGAAVLVRILQASRRRRSEAGGGQPPPPPGRGDEGREA